MQEILTINFPMNIGARLKDLRAKARLSQEEFANSIGLKRGNYAQIELGNQNPTLETVEAVVRIYNTTYDFVIEGKEIAPNAAPIVAPKGKNKGLQVVGNMPKVVTLDTSDKELVTLVPLKAAAGYLNGYGDPEFIENLPTIDIPGVSGATHRAFEVRGNSMPTQHPGSIAIGRWVEKLSDIRDRRVYILLTKFDGIVLKRVLNRLDIDGKFILMSDNDNKKDHPNYPLDPEEILEVWYWRGGVIREFPEPGNTHTRINDLEGRLTLLENRLKSK